MRTRRNEGESQDSAQTRGRASKREQAQIDTAFVCVFECQPAHKLSKACERSEHKRGRESRGERARREGPPRQHTHAHNDLDERREERRERRKETRERKSHAHRGGGRDSVVAQTRAQGCLSRALLSCSSSLCVCVVGRGSSRGRGEREESEESTQKPKSELKEGVPASNHELKRDGKGDRLRGTTTATLPPLRPVCVRLSRSLARSPSCVCVRLPLCRSCLSLSVLRCFLLSISRCSRRFAFSCNLTRKRYRAWQLVPSRRDCFHRAQRRMSLCLQSTTTRFVVREATRSQP